GAMEVSEADMLEGLTVGHRAIQDLVGIQQELLATTSVPKMQWKKVEHPAELAERVKELAEGRIAAALNASDKHARIHAVEAIKAEIVDTLTANFPEQGRAISDLVGDVEYDALRAQVLDTNERVDGRKLNEVRPITIETGVLPAREQRGA